MHSVVGSASIEVPSVPTVPEVIAFEDCATVANVATSALAVTAGVAGAAYASSILPIAEATVVALNVLGGAGDTCEAQRCRAVREY